MLTTLAHMSTTPGLTIADYCDDIRRRVSTGQKAMISYPDWMKIQLAGMRAAAELAMRPIQVPEVPMLPKDR